MGREVRRVPKDWQHPKKREFNYLKGCYEEIYQPMYEWSFAEKMREWWGTPISPAFETPEELARWLVDNNASAFAGETASYEGWLRICKGGFAPSAVLTVRPEGGGTIQNGVDALL